MNRQDRSGSMSGLYARDDSKSFFALSSSCAVVLNHGTHPATIIRAQIGPRRCFNAPKSWQLGWFASRSAQFESSDASLSTRLIGQVDYANVNDSTSTVLLKLNTATDTDYYIGFNRGSSHNSETVDGSDKVMIATQAGEGATIAESELVAMLGSGENFVISDFDGTSRDLTVTVTTIDIVSDPGYADVTVHWPPTSVSICFVSFWMLLTFVILKLLYPHASNLLNNLISTSKTPTVSPSKSPTVAETQDRSVLVVRVVATDASTSVSEARLSDSVFSNNADGDGADAASLKTQMSACSFGQLNFVEAADRDGSSVNIRNGEWMDNFMFVSNGPRFLAPCLF